jgi:hypothetical protein
VTYRSVASREPDRGLAGIRGYLARNFDTESGSEPCGINDDAEHSFAYGTNLEPLHQGDHAYRPFARVKRGGACKRA